MTWSIFSSIIRKYVLIIASLMVTNCYAQNRETDTIDTLTVGKFLQGKVQSLYIKPIFEEYQSLVSVKGADFSSPKGDLLRKRGFGIRIGYQWGGSEIETGLSVIRSAAGYRYIVDGSSGHSTQIRSTDYHQFPLLFRYRIWQPINHLSLHIGAGAAYNVNLDKSVLAIEDHPEEGTLDANGNKVVLARFTRRYNQVKSFFSGEVNVSARWQLLSRLSANFEVKRLISSANIVNLTATQETFNPSTFRDVEAHGGANSYSVNVGVAYQFKSNNRYYLD